MRIGLWFRQDLRIRDQPALQAVLKANYLLPFYIIEATTSTSAHSIGLWAALLALRQELQVLHSDLYLFQGKVEEVLPKIIQGYALAELVWTRRYTPEGIELDKKLKESLQASGCYVVSFPGQLLVEPWAHLKKDGAPYRVFTAFYKSQTFEKIGNILSTPQSLPPLPEVKSLLLFPWQEISWEKTWQKRLWQQWQSRFYASTLLKQQEDFAEKVQKYAQQRDFPALAATSGFSAALALGRVSVRQLFYFYKEFPESEAFVRQLFWRDFAYHLLYHFPYTVNKPLDTRFENFPWENNSIFLAAWQKGQTGIPLVDAGMRQLWQEGVMHNRLRMIVGSFLVKNLLLPWQQGAAWFSQTLIDFDLANNVLGWQWLAGCGADAAPYFRIFNPLLQAEKFDPQGEYIRSYLPQLSHLPSKYLYAPWLSPKPPANYPKPVIDLATSRNKALQALKIMQARSQ